MRTDLLLLACVQTYILPYTIAQWKSDRGAYFQDTIVLEQTYAKYCTNKTTNQARSFRSVTRPVAIYKDKHSRYLADVSVQNLTGDIYTHGNSSGSTLVRGEFRHISCHYKGGFYNDANATRLDCGQFLYVKGYEDQAGNIKAFSHCANKALQMVNCYNQSTKGVLGYVYQLKNPYIDEERLWTPSRGLGFYDGQGLDKTNTMICPYHGFENPVIIPTPQCRAHYIGSSLVEVKCATSHVLPFLCCKYKEQQPAKKSRSKNIVYFKTDSEVTVPFSIIDAFRGKSGADKISFAASCQTHIGLEAFEQNDMENEISIDWYACNKTGERIGLSGTSGTVIAKLQLPTPYFLPSCDGQYSKVGNKWTGECTCYLAKHFTQDKMLMNFDTPGDQSLSVDWYKDGSLVSGQIKNKKPEKYPDKMLADYIIMSTTLILDKVSDDGNYTCKGSSGLPKLRKEKIKEELISKTFSPQTFPQNKATVLECNTTISTGDIAICSCHNLNSNLQYVEATRWEFCDEKFKCEKKAPLNVRVVTRMLRSVVFLYHTEGVDAYYLRCSVGNSSFVDQTIYVGDKELQSPWWAAIISYVMIPIFLVLVGLIATTLKYTIKWYLQIKNTIVFDEVYEMDEDDDMEENEPIDTLQVIGEDEM